MILNEYLGHVSKHRADWYGTRASGRVSVNNLSQRRCPPQSFRSGTKRYYPTGLYSHIEISRDSSRLPLSEGHRPNRSSSEIPMRCTIQICQLLNCGIFAPLPREVAEQLAREARGEPLRDHSRHQGEDCVI
uniref:Uncharacterized protein n=1 Tax=Haemonchus placei TaxID=6290 RepID=A0A0N4X8B0_HAEPC